MPSIVTQRDAAGAIDAAWGQICRECRSVLGSELHYQAMIYHALRLAGHVPVEQLGMNVKQLIPVVQSEFFQKLDLAKNEAYRGGFEPIPDIVIFSQRVAADWRRREYLNTISCMLAVIEVKASERAGKRLGLGEVSRDIRKLVAHREEARHLGHDFYPVMLVLDTARDPIERMTSTALAQARGLAGQLGVEWRCLDPTTDHVDRPTPLER